MRSRGSVQLLLGIVFGWVFGLFSVSLLSAFGFEMPNRLLRLGFGIRSASPSWQISPNGFAAAYEWQRTRQNQSLYYFERPGRLIPMLRLTDQELDRSYRVAVARDWVRTQSLVIAATVRNAMSGLETGLKNLARLRQLFAQSWVVIVENNSEDKTRQRLVELARADPTVTVLGCGTVNSAQPCNIDMRYASGQVHGPGQSVKRTMGDEVDRGLIMSALRNEYLNLVYTDLADKADLMLVLDPDLGWENWNMSSILQGLYYFKTRPRLQQLCANTIDVPSNSLYDPCTLTFFNNKRFGEDTQYPSVDYYKSIHNGAKNLPPVKVESCFQAFAFYRLSDLRAMDLHYERSHGEWMCEHNTLSRQLQEVYIDPQMRIGVLKANVG